MVYIPQSTSPLTLAKETYRAKGIRGFYAGCGALVTGNAVKAAVRFTSYDRFKRLLVNQDVSGKIIDSLQTAMDTDLILVQCAGQAHRTAEYGW
jgi:hypothetical protein